MQYGGMVDHIGEIRTARVALEAALATSDSEGARAAWRLYHRALVLPNSRAGRDARRLLDQAINRSEDDHLIAAKRRYDLALRSAKEAL